MLNSQSHPCVLLSRFQSHGATRLCLVLHFHRRYDESPKCAFSSDRLHFAVHVRMGDRREFLEENSDYFDLLERVMAVISTEVVAKGLTEPHFHIFSETLVPCPSEETGLFDEFPTWPLSKEEVRGGSR